MKRPDATWATATSKRHAPRNVPLARIAPARELVADANKVLTTRRAYPGSNITHKRLLIVLEETDLNHPGLQAQSAELAEHGRNSEIILQVVSPEKVFNVKA